MSNENWRYGVGYTVFDMDDQIIDNLLEDKLANEFEFFRVVDAVCDTAMCVVIKGVPDMAHLKDEQRELLDRELYRLGVKSFGEIRLTGGLLSRAADEPEQEDAVNRPTHYTQHPSGVECIQITEHMNFNLGNAVKYIWRAGLKEGNDKDLEKARWYIDREIKRLAKK